MAEAGHSVTRARSQQAASQDLLPTGLSVRSLCSPSVFVCVCFSLSVSLSICLFLVITTSKMPALAPALAAGAVRFLLALAAALCCPPCAPAAATLNTVLVNSNAIKNGHSGPGGGGGGGGGGSSSAGLVPFWAVSVAPGDSALFDRPNGYMHVDNKHQVGTLLGDHPGLWQRGRGDGKTGSTGLGTREFLCWLGLKERDRREMLLGVNSRRIGWVYFWWERSGTPGAF